MSEHQDYEQTEKMLDLFVQDLEKKLQEQGLTPVYCPEPRCDNRLRFGNVASMIADLRVFLTRPVPEDFGPIECHIRRQVHAKWLTPR